VCTLRAAPVAGFLADTFGRKRVALTALPICIVAGPLAFLAINSKRTAAVV
jgi:MFS family permease